MMAPRLPDSCGTSTQIACSRGLRGLLVPVAQRGQVSVPGERRDLGEQDGPRSLGRVGGGRVDRCLDGGEAALDKRREPGRVPAALRRGVRGLNHVPRQADRRRLRPHGLDQHLGHVDHRRTALAGQRVDSTVGTVSVHAEGEG